jgi:hypothetical protein
MPQRYISHIRFQHFEVGKVTFDLLKVNPQLLIQIIPGIKFTGVVIA